MPNDPRVKFKKKHYDPSHNIIHFGGGGGRGGRSIFEEGNLPRPPPGGGDPPNQTDTPTYRNIEAIPQPLRPDFNAGEITGITIGALAGLGTLEVARRAYLEYLEEERRRRGMRPVSQSDRPIKARRGGNIFERQSRVRVSRAISRGINTAIQSSFEMVTPSSTYRPIPIQSEIMPPSGTTTPNNYEGRVTERGIERWTQPPFEQGERTFPINIRDPQHSSISKALDTDANRLSTIFTSPEGTIGKIEASSITKPAPPIRKPDVALDLQNELEKKQLELNIERARIVPDEKYFFLGDPDTPFGHRLPREGISEGRINTLQAEIKVLERKINSRGIAGDASETSRRILNMALEDRAAIESAGGVGIGSGTRAETELSRQGLADRIDQLNREQFVRDVAKSERIAQESVALENRLIARQAERNKNYSESLINLTPEERTRLENTSIFDINDIHGIQQMTNEEFRAFAKEKGVYIGAREGATGTPEMTKIDFLQDFIENIDLKLMDRQLPIARRQELISKQTELRTILATEQKITTDANIRRAIKNINIPEETRISSSRPRIPKTIAPETPIANNPINDKITAAQPTREVEMQTLGAHEQRLQTAVETMVEVKTQGPTIFEQTRTAIQKATSRKPIEAKVKIDPLLKPPKQPTQTAATKAALERARAASGLSTDVEMRGSSLGQPQIERVAPGGELLATLQEIGVMAPDVPPEPIERRAPAPEEFGTELKNVEELRFSGTQQSKETALDLFNKTYDRFTKQHTIEGYEMPEAPAGMSDLESKKFIMDEIIKQTVEEGRDISIAKGTPNEKVISPEEAYSKVQKQYAEALNDPNKLNVVSPEEHITSTSTKKGKGKIKKTGLLATEEQRLRPTALAGEAQARVQARTAPAEVRTTAPVETARAPMAETMTARAAAPEISARAAAAPEISARTAPAPEIAARRRMGVPELTAPPPVAPEERASFAERQAFFEKTSRPAPPIEEATPSAPPSAPGTETATPREGIVTERTPAERASFAEEVKLGMNKKIGRQKAKLNLGKPKITANPLERFVAPQFRNAPNIEIHPGSKGFRGALIELGARVPRLVPTRQVLLNAGGNLAAEGGGMVAGFYAGSEAGKAMSNYFATHPPNNRGEEFGQALATSMVALGVGNLTAKVVTYVIKQGVRAALMGEVSGSISSAGSAGASAILEAALFATVATTTQFYTTKALEDAGYNHETSRGLGSAAATEALLGLEFVAFMAKGGPLNPFAIGSFVASELFILGFGIWSFFEETEAGRLEDIEEQANREAVAAEQAAARVERQNAIDKINRTNSLRSGFMVAMETHDYDFDKVYATLTDEDKVAMGISTPESKSAFQRQVESAFDPFGSFAEPSPGIVAPEVLTPIEQQRRDVFNSYINWYLGELRGETQPPFNFNDPKVQELNEYSGGTWQSAAAVTATTNHMQAERVHPLIVNAQNEIINAFHNDHKTIEEMPPEVVRYANLDSNFRNSYEAYIVTEAQAQILIEFNRTQYTYNDVDPKLLEIADRDPNFRAAADAYYQTMANQARDLNLPISEVARLNALMENEQAIEIGKLNDARNLIIERNQAQNQAQIDAYNANIIREINIYGDNFEAIIRNINEQSLLSGHTFLYASNKADLYRQLHMEMPELELVDPVDEIDKPDATFHPGKGRKVGDTALYGYRYNLTDEQNQELEDMIARKEIRREDAERQAALIRERDRYIYEETDQERADSLNMSLEDYYAKYGIPIDPYTMPIVDFKLNGKPPDNGRVRMPDGSIRTYRNGFLVDTTAATVIETPAGTYNPALAQQPDGEIRMPDGSIRTYKDGKVTFVVYNTSTPGNERLSPDEINAQIDATRGPTYEQLQQQYPLTYNNLLEKHANDPNKDSIIEATLKRAYAAGFDEVAAWANKGDDTIDTGDNAGPTPVTPPQPVSTVLFNGERTMPDGTTRTYKAGKVTSIGYPEGTPPSQMLDKKGLANLNKQEGLYYDPNPPTVTPTGPTEPLKNGIVKMPDGSERTYQNGLVIFVQYGNTNVGQKTPKEINEEEGIQNATYTGPTVTPTTPVAPTAPLQQGAIKMPDGSKRIYIDGKVVSVAYPDGLKGPTINEINAAEGTKTAEPPSITNTNPMTAVDDLFKGKTPRPTPAPAPTPPPEEEVVLGSRLDSLMGNTAPAPAPAPTTTTN